MTDSNESEKRIIVSAPLPVDLLARIDEYQRMARIDSRANAVRNLLAEALDAREAAAAEVRS